MRFKFFGIAFLIPFFLCCTAWAQQSSSTEENICCYSEEFSPFDIPPKTEREAIDRVLDIFHFAVDGEHMHAHHSMRENLKSIINPMTYYHIVQSLFESQTWVTLHRNANIPRVFNDAYKAYNIETQHELTKKHAQNVLAIYPLSHGTEMAAPFIFLYASQFLDLTTGQIASITAGLGTISLPGVDILCIVIFASYPLKAVHKPISWMREMGTKSVSKAWSKVNTLTHWNESLLRNFTRESGLDRAERLALELVHKSRSDRYRLYHRRSSNDQLNVFVIDPENSKVAEMEFRSTQSSHEAKSMSFLKRLSIRPEHPESYELIQLLAKQLGPLSSLNYNVKRHINQSRKLSSEDLLALRQQFYIQEVHQTPENTVEFMFEDRAINVRSSFKRSKSCLSLF